MLYYFYHVDYNVRWFEWLFMQWFYNVDNIFIAYSYIELVSINVINRGPLIWSQYLEC